mmetsp:Transcript_1793/g.3652  ORF Transcript_1793/g.3652 Transcript_1793/m.3652 type:complete len:389 (+) Transcript_1793:155-1321(+)
MEWQRAEWIVGDIRHNCHSQFGILYDIFLFIILLPIATTSASAIPRLGSFQIRKDQHILVKGKQSNLHILHERSVHIFPLRCRGCQSLANLTNRSQRLEPSMALHASVMMMMMIRRRCTLLRRWGDIFHAVKVHILHRSLLPYAVRPSHFVLYRAATCGLIERSVRYGLLRQGYGRGCSAHVAIVRLDGVVRAAQKGRGGDGRAEWIEVGLASIAAGQRGYGAGYERFGVGIVLGFEHFPRSAKDGDAFRIIVAWCVVPDIRGGRNVIHVRGGGVGIGISVNFALVATVPLRCRGYRSAHAIIVARSRILLRGGILIALATATAQTTQSPKRSDDQPQRQPVAFAHDRIVQRKGVHGTPHDSRMDILVFGRGDVSCIRWRRQASRCGR